VHRLAPTILALALLAAACGAGEGFGSTTAPSTTLAGETTVPTTPPTTVPPETTTTTAPRETTTSTTIPPTTTTSSGTFYIVDTTHFFPDPFPGSSGGAHGSGCVTPGFDALPDGVWFGFAEGVGGGKITFDLACFYTGTAACDAQIEDGVVNNPVNDCLDDWIRNNVATTFQVPIAAAARVWYVDMLDSEVITPIEIPLRAWPSPDSFQTCPGDYCSVWLYVNGGQATGIVEQYLP